MKCQACGLHYRWPRFDRAALDLHYAEASLSNWPSRLIERRDWALAIDWIVRHDLSGSILDVGCFDGKFLSYLKKRMDLFGIEINRHARLEAQKKGITLIGEKHEGLTNVSTHFDVITAFDVIEHLEDPFDFLKALTKSVNNGGYILLSSGNTNCWSWRLEKGKYWYARIPEHISFIGTAWCRFAAERLDLRICGIRTFSHETKSAFSKRIKESCANLLCLAWPRGYEAVHRRLNRVLGRATRKNSKNSTPYWGTSRDHLLVMFRHDPS